MRFVSEPIEGVDAQFQSDTQGASTLKGKVFGLGRRIISSEFMPVDHLRKFLNGAEGVVVELGSGSRRLRADVINVDLFPSGNVDVVADISQLPMKSGCADFVILDSVIEHVPNPILVIAEAKRILKPGGRLFINCPFMLPYHGYPKHYQNYTRDGLEHLLAEFTNVRIRPTFGPISALVNMVSETVAVAVGGERGWGYVAVKGLTLLPMFWLKYLDILFVRSDRSHRLAGMLCATGVR